MHEARTKTHGVGKYRPVIRSVGVGYPGTQQTRRPIADEASVDPSVVRFPHPARDWATKRGKRSMRVCVKVFRKMGQKKSKPSGPMGGVTSDVRLPRD